jgi:peptidoglycan hydrolase CwlO-like protein
VGRNKDLRKNIAGWRRQVNRHNGKIEDQLSRPNPDCNLIEKWKREIEGFEEKIRHLERRLKREW